MAKVNDEFRRVLEHLKADGLLLQNDAKLPSVCALVAGSPVKGSWWAHPRSHEIFRVTCELADHAGVFAAKLVSGKVTFVDRALWPAVVALGRAREPWQMDSLSPDAAKLLLRLDKTSPIETDGATAKPATELEKALLVYSEQFHGTAGSHARRLESWGQWSERTGFTSRRLERPDHARRKLEEALDALNLQYHARGRLPWQS